MSLAALGCKGPASPGNDGGSAFDAGVFDGGTDAGPADSGAVDAGSPVLVSRTLHFVTESGISDLPDDLTQAGLAAWVPDPTTDGGFIVYEGSVVDAGLFRFPDVPTQGSYFLTFGRDLILTRSRSVDLSEYRWGRPDALEATPGTLLDVSLSGLAPWQPGEDLRGTSAGAGLVSGSLSAGLFQRSADGGSAVPVRLLPGDTAASGSLSYFDLYPPNRVESAKGDVFFAYQLVAASADAGGTAVPYLAAGASFSTSSLDIPVDAGEVALSGQLSALAQDQLLQITLDPSAFASVATGINPSASFSSLQLYVDALPSGGSYASRSGSPDLLVLVTDAGAPMTAPLAYGNPFPATWQPFGIVRADFQLSAALPDGDGGFLAPWVGTASLQATTDLASLPAAAAQPGLIPITGWQINGQSALDALSGVGLTPLLTWAPPARGTPSGYRLRVWRLSASGGSTERTEASGRFLLDAATNQLALPAGILEPGTSYVFELTALSAAGWSAQAPYLISLPVYEATAFSGVVSP